MRPKFWACDEIHLDLVDRDVIVKFTHIKTLAAVTVALRLSEAAVDTTVGQVKRRAEHLASECVRDLASFLDQA